MQQSGRMLAHFECVRPVVQFPSPPRQDKVPCCVSTHFQIKSHQDVQWQRQLHGASCSPCSVGVFPEGLCSLPKLVCYKGTQFGVFTRSLPYLQEMSQEVMSPVDSSFST